MMDRVESQIQQVWATEQEILDVIHKVCTENGLRYSLAYGTLIGAVRHKGFIPWDDDIDLMMPREDYEKLLAIWNQAAPKGYLLQNYHTYTDYTNNFAKIVKDHTTFLQKEEDRTASFHKGVFVDIFPGDRVAPGRFRQKIQYVACAVNLLYSRGYTSGAGGVMGMIERILLRIPRNKQIHFRDKAEKIISKWSKSNQLPYLFSCTIDSSRLYYPSDMFDGESFISFCGKEYRCVNDYDKILRIQYGDYMQLPPEEERVWKHHPILIDFEHNYEELTGQQ